VGIVTYKALFARLCRALAGEDANPRSKRLRFETAGMPTVHLAYTIEDCNLASPASDAPAGCGVDVFADWTFGRLFGEFDDEGANRLRTRLGLAGSWLAVFVSELTHLARQIPYAQINDRHPACRRQNSAHRSASACLPGLTPGLNRLTSVLTIWKSGGRPGA
jgi:hypothetical protein